MTPSWSKYIRWLEDAAVQKESPKVAAPAPDWFSTDSRNIKTGEWFVPIAGETFDGHKFIEAAMKNGASGFFYAVDAVGTFPENLKNRGFAVTDTLLAFQKIALGWRRSLKQLQLIAITGSSGKTTTKEMTSAILQAAGPALATQGSFNNEVGVPKTLLLLKPQHATAVLEFGARSPGNIKFLCAMGEPNVAALLNVGKSHLGIFGSIENLLNTKLEMFRNSPANATLIANHDDKRIFDAAVATGKKVLSFGFHQNASVRITSQKWLPEGAMEIKLLVQGAPLDLKLQTAHEAYALNAAAACAAAAAVGISLATMKKGLESFTGIKGRYQVHKLNNFILIDDCYNANPASMALGFKTLAHSFSNQKKIVILGDMLELGDDSALEHFNIGQECRGVLQPSFLITVGKDAYQIAAGAREKGQKAADILSFETVDQLISHWQSNPNLSSKGDVIYIKASNGIKLCKLVDHIMAVEKKCVG